MIRRSNSSPITAAVVAELEAMTANKVELSVLLFQGPAIAAPAIARSFRARLT